MSTRSGRGRTRLAPVVATLCLTLAACSGGSSSTSTGGPTPTPSTSVSPSTSADPATDAHAAQLRLHRAVARMRKSSHVLISTNIDYGDTYSQQLRGRYEVAGNRFDGTVKEFTGRNETGYEVYHRGGTTVLRLLSATDGCWWNALGSPAGSYAAPVPPELEALLGAQVSGGHGLLLKGTLPAAPLGRVLESPVALRRDHVSPSSGARVAGTFVIRDGIVAEFDTTVARVLRSSGITPPHLNGGDTWSMTYSLDAGAPIVDPPPDHIVSVSEDDPHREDLVAACTARIQ